MAFLRNGGGGTARGNPWYGVGFHPRRTSYRRPLTPLEPWLTVPGAGLAGGSGRAPRPVALREVPVAGPALR